VFSGNSRDRAFKDGLSGVPVKNPVIQANSLRELGHEVDCFLIVGKGISGYLKNIPKLKDQVKRGNYDIIHAHYSLTAIAVSLAGVHDMVVSLAGSDTMGMPFMLPVIRFFCRHRWKTVIVKTEQMKLKIGQGNIIVLPNGVDTQLFRPLDKNEARVHLGLDRGSKIILFVADPLRREKNYNLAVRAFNILNRSEAVLLPVFNVPHDNMPYYYNAADVLLITSLWEGSVNSVKEAMACNLPVVSTDVGDVRSNTSGLECCYITSYDALEIAEKLGLAIDSMSEINSRDRIFELGLDARSISLRLTEKYKSKVS
jgi:glycosyltransferase involved in cell wall biosynthesis